MIVRIFIKADVCTLALASASAQQRATRFTSVYTSLGAGCKILRGQGGTDDAKLCGGPGGYQVRVYSSAMTTEIAAELKGSDGNFHVASASLAFNESRSRVEWRLANGKPFALIMRVPTYADRTDGEGGFGKQTGDALAVVGLKGYESLTTSIDARTPGANVRAREAADKGYAVK